MIGVVDRVRQSIVDGKEAIIRKIREMQKPILDQKIDEMLKDASKTQRIMVKYLGIGKGIGRRLGGFMGVGRSLLKAFRIK
ncbi:MAG: hypothetical protein ABIH11_09310 [Candidatus Altiarchaeota archaeon]